MKTKNLVIQISAALNAKREDKDILAGIMQRMNENDAMMLEYLLNNDILIMQMFNELNDILKDENDQLKAFKKIARTYQIQFELMEKKLNN